MNEQAQTAPLQLAQQLVFFVAEKITRACLQLDPGTRARLHNIAGRTIALHIKDSLPLHPDGIKIFICTSTHGIELFADSRVPADASISLCARDLLHLLRNRLDKAHTLTAEGDQELLATVLDIVRGLDIDWESAIAPFTGDIIAHQVGKNFRATEKWLSQSLQEAKRLAEEYINEELPVARQSGHLKPVFDNLEKIKASSDGLREKLVEAATRSSFFKPKK